MADRIQELRSLLDSDPSDTFCLYSLAMEYDKQGERDQALAYFDRAIELEPDYAYAYFHKARVQAEGGDAGSARSTLEEGLRQAKETGDAQAESEISGFLDELG